MCKETFFKRIWVHWIELYRNHIVIIRNEEKSKMQRLYPIAGVFERDLKKDIMKNVLYSIGKWISIFWKIYKRQL